MGSNTNNVRPRLQLVKACFGLPRRLIRDSLGKPGSFLMGTLQPRCRGAVLFAFTPTPGGAGRNTGAARRDFHRSFAG